jgi:nicotinate-nucleotide--dimethylbenzimidazole phosphoribosyltransferase
MITESHVWARLDSLAKPRRSLGRLEELAVRLAMIQQSLRPVSKPRHLALFAGDHGVVASGVSAWGSEVTALMVHTIVAGRSASAALAATHDCALRVVDVGISTPLTGLNAPNFLRAAIAPGTRDLSCEPAMTGEEFEAAWDVGVAEARGAIGRGGKILLAGEMGIGNTTAAACLTTLLVDVAPDLATGRGAGADDATLETKRRVVDAATRRARAILQRDARAAIALVAGFEIVAMAGFFAEAARHPVVSVLDGYVATAAALIAERLQPGVAARLVASHLSSEPGHGPALAALGLMPLLDWNMRLGEGTGALLALPLIDSAATLLADVASLDDLGLRRED